MGSIPAGSTKPAPLPMQGRGLGISIGEDQPHEVRRFAPTQSARGRSPKYSRREYQARAPANAGARAWYFNRGGPAAQGAAVRPDAVGTRAQPEVFPPGVGIKIGLYQKILLSGKKE